MGKKGKGGVAGKEEDGEEGVSIRRERGKGSKVSGGKKQKRR